MVNDTERPDWDIEIRCDEFLPPVQSLILYQVRWEGGEGLRKIVPVTYMFSCIKDEGIHPYFTAPYLKQLVPRTQAKVYEVGLGWKDFLQIK